MSSAYPPQTKLLRAWMALDSEVHRQWMAAADRNGYCWVCRRSRCKPANHWGSTGKYPGRHEWATLAIVKALYGKGKAKMGWKDSRKHAEERPEFVSLKDDGDNVDFIPLTEPAPTTKPGFNAGETRDVYRVGCLVLPGKIVKPSWLDMSLRQFESYADSVGEGHELKSVVRMVRLGKANDTNTLYTFQVVGKAGKAAVTKAKAAAKQIVNV